MKNLRHSIPKYNTSEIPFNISDIQIHDNRLYFSLIEQMCNNNPMQHKASNSKVIINIHFHLLKLNRIKRI